MAQWHNGQSKPGQTANIRSSGAVVFDGLWKLARPQDVCLLYLASRRRRWNLRLRNSVRSTDTTYVEIDREPTGLLSVSISRASRDGTDVYVALIYNQKQTIIGDESSAESSMFRLRSDLAISEVLRETGGSKKVRRLFVA